MFKPGRLAHFYDICHIYHILYLTLFANRENRHFRYNVVIIMFMPNIF